MQPGTSRAAQPSLWTAENSVLDSCQQAAATADGTAEAGLRSSAFNTAQQGLAAKSDSSTGWRAQLRRARSLPARLSLRKLGSGPAQQHSTALSDAKRNFHFGGSSSDSQKIAPMPAQGSAASPDSASHCQLVQSSQAEAMQNITASAQPVVTSAAASAAALGPHAAPETAVSAASLPVPRPAAVSAAASSIASGASSPTAGWWDFAEERQTLYGHLMQHLCCPVSAPDSLAASSGRPSPTLSSRPSRAQSLPRSRRQAWPKLTVQSIIPGSCVLVLPLALSLSEVAVSRRIADLGQKAEHDQAACSPVRYHRRCRQVQQAA